MIAPPQIGMPNRIFKAIDEPITSYREKQHYIDENCKWRYLNIRPNDGYLSHEPKYDSDSLRVLFSTKPSHVPLGHNSKSS
jgi:hypothetical protein